MSVEVLDSATIVGFVEDEEAFNAFIGNRFSRLDVDVDGNGRLSYAEMLRDLRACECSEEQARVHGSLFVQFNHDADWSVYLEEFKEEMRMMMLATADEHHVSQVMKPPDHDLSQVMKPRL